MRKINSVIAIDFDVTVVDKDTGNFESRDSFTVPIGKGYEYVEEYDKFKSNFFKEEEFLKKNSINKIYFRR